MTGFRARGKYAAGYSRARRMPDGSDAGFTLTEVIVAIAIFTVVSVATVLGLTNLIKGTRITTDRVTASNLAREQIEKLRLQNATGHALDSGTIVPAPVHGVRYTMVVYLSPAVAAPASTSTATATATATPTTGSAPECMSIANTYSPTPALFRRATVIVNWGNANGRQVQYDTVLSC